MLSLRNLAIGSGFIAMAALFLPVAVAAQLSADDPPQYGQPDAPAKPAGKRPDPRRPPASGAPMTGSSQGGPDSILRPAAAVPPERIQVEPGPQTRPVLAPQDDPRSVEALKRETDATDR